MDQDQRAKRDTHLVADFEAAANRRLALVVLAADGKVISSSPTADAILGSSDGLSVAAGRLRAAVASEQAKLQSAIARAAAGESADGEAPILVQRRSGKRPYVVSLESLSPRPGGQHEVAQVMAVISDTERKAIVSPKLLQVIYDLAPREANLVALLVQGMELKEAAGQLGIQETSARTYLKDVFSKTATHRQAELVSVVMSGVAALLPL